MTHSDRQPANAERPLPALALLPRMVVWYGVRALVQTGIRDTFSRAVGRYTDQRILQAAVDRPTRKDLVERYDYTIPGRELPESDGGVWVDYVADTADGFSSTYAVANLISADSVDVEIDGRVSQLPGSHLLIMGGDQVYPYASDIGYQERLRQPFDLTVHNAPELAGQRRLMAIPGNHDWYDGLSSFDRLFCSRRDGLSTGARIGRYACEQHRSYWAIRLPHDWWIWGLDVQLTSSLDAGQMQYFAEIAKELPSEDSKARIILCIAEPSWIGAAETGSFASYAENLQRILNLAIDKARVVTVLAGDSHHYSRYFSPKHRINLITSGGGGSYLAPTHHLPSTLQVPWKMTAEGKPRLVEFRLNASVATDDATVENKSHAARPEAAYPPKYISRGLGKRILAFPITNWSFCVALGFIYALMYWFFSSVEVVPLELHKPFLAAGRRRVELDTILLGAKHEGERLVLLADTFPMRPWHYFYYLFEGSRWQPFLAFTVLSVLGLIFHFFVHAKNLWKRRLISVAFWLVHVMAMAYLAHFLLWYAVRNTDLIGGGWWRIAFTVAGMWLGGGLIAGLLCGTYLWFATIVSPEHADGGFSSIRNRHYKNFMRMHVTKDVLTIYPIGLDRVPRHFGWRRPTQDEIAAGARGGYVARKRLEPRLIEGPIVIRPADIVDMKDDDPTVKPAPILDPVEEQKFKPQTAV